MRKKCIALLLCLLLPLLPACGAKGPRVAILIYDGNDTFISEMLKKMEFDMPDDVIYKVCDAANSQAVQNQQIVELIADGIDLLIINAVDRLACSAIVEKCSKVGIQVIFFNREPLGDAMNGGNVFYVGAAADSLGERQAEMVSVLFGPDFEASPFDKNGDGVVQLIILKGEQGHQDAERRTENCINGLKARGYKVEILAVEVANWVREEAYSAMVRLYADYGEQVELIFANNDDMALGVIDYMTEIGAFRPSSSGYDQPFVLVGVDGTAVGLDAIERGLLYGTVLNDSTAQAQAILTLMDHLLAEKALSDYPYEIINDHYIYIDGAIILREDVARYRNS